LEHFPVDFAAPELEVGVFESEEIDVFVPDDCGISVEFAEVELSSQAASKRAPAIMVKNIFLICINSSLKRNIAKSM
jgi:hypothetical protein